MYAYLNGQLTYKSPTTLHIDINGVGYLVNISLNTYSKIESLDSAKLYTYLHVKEDQLTLFGFHDEEERSLFILLLSVSGIGPNTARIVLSSMSPLEVRTAILTDNDVAFKKVKGVGPKTAKRIILDLRDKVQKGGAMSTDTTIPVLSTSQDEALDALVALGFVKAKVQKVLDQLPASGASVEVLIKSALQKLT
ncbi:UNVERIFIED_CONTAM: hypothetical protein GTU68_043773 [Idotea baltica]|nr:hypothetical protein [Idotea baltica]